MTKAKRNDGFTLIEILAAMVLLVLLATVLFGSVRYAERATTASNEVVERTEQFSRTHAFLREHMASVLPLRWRLELGQPTKFVGSNESVTYLAPVTSHIATGGVLWWRLMLAGDSGKQQLILRYLPQDPTLKAAPDVWTGETIVLANGIASLKLSYFDPGDDPVLNPDSGVWRDSWEETSRMPNLLRMQVTETDGKSWPDLIVPFKLSLAIGCNFDYTRQRCNI